MTIWCESGRGHVDFDLFLTVVGDGHVSARPLAKDPPIPKTNCQNPYSANTVWGMNPPLWNTKVVTFLCLNYANDSILLKYSIIVLVAAFETCVFKICPEIVSRM